MIASLVVLILLAVSVVGWHRYEAWWDRRLFERRVGCRVENVHTRQGAALLAEDPEMQVLDVRSAWEFADGALPRAIQICISDPAFRVRVSGGFDPQKPVLVYCAGGYRSRKAVALLRELGFTQIHHLHRGFFAWRIKWQPVESTMPAKKDGLQYS